MGRAEIESPTSRGLSGVVADIFETVRAEEPRRGVSKLIEQSFEAPHYVWLLARTDKIDSDTKDVEICNNAVPSAEGRRAS